MFTSIPSLDSVLQCLLPVFTHGLRCLSQVVLGIPSERLMLLQFA